MGRILTLDSCHVQYWIVPLSNVTEDGRHERRDPDPRGILLLSLVTVETGGLYLLKLWRSSEGVTEFQIGFARAGHAHAGVLLVLALTALLYADTAGLSGAWNWIARSGVPVAALLMPAGFFAASMGQGRTQPQRADRPGLRRRGRAGPGAGQPRGGAAGGVTVSLGDQ